MQLDFSFLWENWELIANGLWVTTQLSLAAIAVGFVLGTLLAVARRSQSRAFRVPATIYVEAIRNTPLLIQIFLTFFGLSMLGLRLPAMVVALLAMTINTAAYACEIVRAGFDSIRTGQWEAAEALGLSKVQAYWHVALLPAVERVYPSLSSQFVLMMLATSITSLISVEELTAVANFLQAQTYRPFETYIATAILYLILSLGLRALLWQLGQLIFPRMNRAKAN